MRIQLLAGLALALTSCTSAPPAGTTTSTEQHSSAVIARAQAVLDRVEPDQVCMVNNRFMGSPQIPVSVGSKTYFGCCEMCKSRLTQDASARTATDPVSGAQVDKADAVIGKDAAGAVYYFETDTNLEQYSAR